VLLLLCAQPTAFARDLNFITIDVAPWAWREDGRDLGVFPELVRELAARTGQRIHMRFEPFARIERELQAGTQDCAIIIWNETRLAFVHRGADVSPHTMGVIARSGVRLRHYDDLLPLTISVLRGAAFEPVFDADTRLTKDFDNSYLIGLHKIARGRADAVAGAVATIRHLAEREGLAHLLGDELVLGQIPLVLQCSSRSANLDLMPELNRSIEHMVADGTVTAIKKKYGF
jgi:polar amino acid transport system substrate-binding protein